MEDSTTTDDSWRNLVTRARLEMQGFVGLDDRYLAEVAPWFRLTPALSAAWVAVGTLRASPAIVGALAPIVAAGALHRRTPFDALYNHGLRHLRGTRPLPPNGPPRRFASGVATAWLAATALAFANDKSGLGRALGATFVALALVPATTDFCVPSFLYGLLFGRPAACDRDDAAGAAD